MKHLLFILIIFCSLHGFGQIKGYWRLNNSLADDSGNGYTLTNSGGVYKPGKSFNCLETSISPVRYAYTTAVGTAQGTGPITISLWLMAYQFASASLNYQLVIDACTGTYYTQDGIMIVWESSLSKICYYHGRRGTNSTFLVGTTAHDLNKWYHVVITFSGTATGQMKLYINGKLINSATNVGIGSSSPLSGITIGAHDTGGALSFNGKVDDVKVLYEVVTPTWIKNEYAKGIGFF